MSAPFRTLFRWAREALEALGEAIPDKAVVIFKRPPGAWEVRALSPDDVGAAPASHTHPTATAVAPGFMSAQDKQKLDLLQPERPAWREIRVGTQVIPAEEGAERLTLQAGANVTLTPDVANKRVIISATGGGGGGGSGGGGYGSVIVGETTLTADSGEPLVLDAVAPLAISADEDTDTITFTVQMGDGSGLDADTVDGLHASAFALTDHTHPDYALIGHTHEGVYAPVAHTHPNATTTTPGFMSETDKQKLDGIQPGAEVNQNAYSRVRVGSVLISAQSKTDTLELEAGSNVTLTPDATNRKVTISASSSSNPAFAKVRVGTDEISASTVADTFTVAGLGEAQASLDTSSKTVQIYVPARNSFGKVRVGSTDVTSGAPNDTLELVAGSNITLTPDADNKRVTIASTASGGNAFGQIKVGAQTLVADVANALVELIASGYITITLNTTNKTITFAIDAGNNANQIPVSNGTRCTNLNADKVDGYDAGTSSGQIPISNGTICSNLNADRVDNYHVSDILNASWARGGSGAGYTIFVQSTAPSGASVGDVWIDTSQTA
jgi:hypothetical protein